MEIGFGNGEHLAALHETYKDVNFIGAEPFMNGMAIFLKTIRERDTRNMRVMMDDAMLLVRSLKENTLDRLYILNPDPWPKNRHHKRRIVNQKNLSEFARVLKPGSLLLMSSDVQDLADWMEEHAMQHPDFSYQSKSMGTPPSEFMLTTRYAQKGLTAGRQQAYMVFQRA